MSKISTEKSLALLEELETAYKLIRIGFGELQNLDSVNNFYFLPFQLLSQGLERFMKAYICLAYQNKHKAFPSLKYMKELNHNLIASFEVIINSYYSEYQSPLYTSDYEFLKNNEDIRELLKILSDFGQGLRYYNLDLITNSSKSKSSTNPRASWDEFRNKLLNSEDYKQLIQEDTQREVHQKIIRYIIITFEKFISALSRQIAFEGIGQTAKSLSNNNFSDFCRLTESSFGITDYRLQTQNYQNKPIKAHKRTLYDELRGKLNASYKRRKISRSEYDGDWPFYADEVIVECREKEWCIVIINGFEYGLNGSAQRRYNLSNPHDAGMAILGKNISEFIEIAKEL